MTDGLIPESVGTGHITDGAFRLYAFLSAKANGERQVWASHQELAYELGKNPRTIGRHLKALEGIGAVVLHRPMRIELPHEPHLRLIANNRRRRRIAS